ncbi:MAG: N-acetyltransferase [Sphingobacteriales bacterium]|nr:MAG: N-acetyltransferase [Sphingobacteriales bacterium]
MSIIIETPRLILRRSTMSDYTRIFEEQTSEEAMAYLGAANEDELSLERSRYEKGLETYRTSFVYFHLIEKSSLEVIGDCCFHTWYTPHARAEIGYGIKKEIDKNKGYMREALYPVLRYGFAEMGLHRVEAFVNPDNLPSQKLLLGVGFKQEGVLKEHYYKNGEHLDSIVLGLLRKNFL